MQAQKLTRGRNANNISEKKTEWGGNERKLQAEAEGVEIRLPRPCWGKFKSRFRWMERHRKLDTSEMPQREREPRLLGLGKGSKFRGGGAGWGGGDPSIALEGPGIVSGIQKDEQRTYRTMKA